MYCIYLSTVFGFLLILFIFNIATKLDYRHCMRWRQSIYGKEHAGNQATNLI